MAGLLEQRWLPKKWKRRQDSKHGEVEWQSSKSDAVKSHRLGKYKSMCIHSKVDVL